MPAVCTIPKKEQIKDTYSQKRITFSEIKTKSAFATPPDKKRSPDLIRTQRKMCKWPTLGPWAFAVNHSSIDWLKQEVLRLVFKYTAPQKVRFYWSILEVLLTKNFTVHLSTVTDIISSGDIHNVHLCSCNSIYSFGESLFFVLLTRYPWNNTVEEAICDDVPYTMEESSMLIHVLSFQLLDW